MSEHYFPPGRSVLRRVHDERAVGLLYGQRALLIGACDPLTYTGTMLSTKAGDMPFRRLVHTGKLQETIMLGTWAEADAVTPYPVDPVRLPAQAAELLRARLAAQATA